MLAEKTASRSAHYQRIFADDFGGRMNPMGTEIVVEGQSFASARESGVASKKFPNDQFIVMLSQLYMHADSVSLEERNEVAGLLLTRDEQNKRIQVLWEKVEKQQHDKLIEQHEALKIQCRQKRSELEKLKEKINELEQRITSLELDPSSAYQKTLTSLKIAQAELEALDQFSSRKEIAAAKAKVADAATAFNRAEGQIAPLQNEINQLSLHSLSALSASYAELVQRELELGAEIEGRQFTDQFGIIHKGAQPLTL